ncbi:MAG: hypothetical protein MH219_03695 [Marinobacter sp.]|nr:hypothetical protein [Marinobacter sp.]
MAQFITEEDKKFKASLPKNFDTKEEAASFLNSCINAKFKVADLQKKTGDKISGSTVHNFNITAGSFRKLYFPVAKTMMIAQRLYEAGTNNIHENRQS